MGDDVTNFMIWGSLRTGELRILQFVVPRERRIYESYDFVCSDRTYWASSCLLVGAGRGGSGQLVISDGVGGCVKVWVVHDTERAHLLDFFTYLSFLIARHSYSTFLVAAFS